MDLGLKDKIVIVTGGAKGIGAAIAIALAKEGGFAVIVGRNEEENNVTVKEIQNNSGKAFGIKAELSVPAECANVIKIVAEKFGRIDGLVNNAGANDGVGLEHGDYERFMKSLHNNMIHYYLMAHHCLPWLKESKGSIVNITSKTAETGQGNTSAYAAANGGRNAL
ncbi:MAG TPA: SDR family NAD(P)-dependent oxidoreductase, partial [Flavisolibacter sp.]|nr:SDR family NAD(P)-dependent oxidoreductase [Flavisolibacter sp.]